MLKLRLAHENAWKFLVLFSISAAWFLTTPALGVEKTAVWNGGSGNWNSASNWNITEVPNNNGDTYIVNIDGGKTGTDSTVSLNMNVTIDGMTIDSGDTLNQLNSYDVNIVEGLTTNNGTWNMNSLNSTTYLRFYGTSGLSGAGQLNMSNALYNYIWTDGSMLTQSSGHTIRGAGQILQNTGGMINQGTIIANQPTLMTIDPDNLGFTNNGILRAEGAGGITLQNGTFSNTASDIDVLNGSQLTVYTATFDNTGLSIDLQGNAPLTIYNSTINGGNISAVSGTISFTGGTSTLNDVAVTGAVNQATNATVEIQTGITHNGTWDMNGSPLRFNGGLTLLGTGEINMSNSASNYIRTDNTVLTIPASRTIRGAGQILYNTGGMINHGTIIANQPTAITIRPNNLEFTNHGLLRAEGTGGIILYYGTFSNTASDIEVLDGSQLTVQNSTLDNTGLSIDLQGNAPLTIYNSTIDGGDISADSGTISFTGGTSTLNDVVVTGTVTQAVNATVEIQNGITHNGTWSMNGSPLRFNGGLTLLGTGEINMSNSATNYIRTDNTVLTIPSSRTIRGAGRILWNTGGMINQGTIIANQPTAITIYPNNLGFTNQGVLRAEGTGGIILYYGTFSNTASDIEVLNGSQLTVQNSTLNNTGLSIDLQGDAPLTIYASTINGGDISADSGAISFTGGTSTLNNVPISGTVTQAVNATVEIQTGITHNGTWNMNGSSLRFNGGLTLLGSGEINMSNSAANYIRTDNTVLTIPSSRTIRGAGQILYNTGGMVNQGTIIADQPTAITIRPNNLGFTNQGVLRPEGAGGIILYYGTFSNTASDIEVLNGSQLTVQSATLNNTGLSIDLQGDAPLTIYSSTINGGDISADSGAINFTGAVSTLNNVPLSGTVDQANGADVEIQNGLTHDGTWNMNALNSTTYLRFNGGSTLLGTGEINMSNSAYNYIYTDNTVLTIPSSRTIRGAGQILYNTGGMINQGSIIANQPTAITIRPNTLGFTNEGILRAEGAGGITLQNGTFSNTASDIDVLNGSQLTVQTATLDNTGLSIGLQGDAPLTIYNSTINGGSILADSGAINFTGGTSTLNDVVVTGTVTQANNATVEIRNGITHDGTWNMNSTNYYTYLRFIGGLTLLGTGEINMSNSAYNRIYTDNTVLTIPSSRTIRGAGQILYNTGGMINQGTIIADQATAITIYPNNLGFANEGTLEATGDGGITVTNSAYFENTGSVEIGSASSLTASNDYTQSAGNTLLDDGTLAVVSGSVALQGGTLQGTGTVDGDVTNSGGSVEPGVSAGIITINGDYTQENSAALNIEIGGLDKGIDFDSLSVSGIATLDGSLNVTFSIGFAPSAGDSFEILTYGSRSGSFSNVNVPNLSDELTYHLIYTSSAAELVISKWQTVYGFVSDREEWTTGGAPVVFSLPDFSWESDYLKIISLTNTNTFGYWQSPWQAISVDADHLYRARFSVSTDITDQALVPQIRLRANTSNLQQYDMLSIDSAGDGGASPAASGTDYNLYFVPPANDTAPLLAFDVLNFNPFDAAVAELSLDTVTLDRFALDSLSLPTVVQDYTFELSQDGWTTGGAPIAFSSPQYIHSGGALVLRSTTNTNTFGFWGNSSTDITIEANKLYRGIFEIRTDVTNPVLVPEMRLRYNTWNLQASHTFGITSAGDGTSSPWTTNTTYDRLYFLPPANCVGESLLVSFDILNFNPGDARTASLILDRVIIETLSPPELP